MLNLTEVNDNSSPLLDNISVKQEYHSNNYNYGHKNDSYSVRRDNVYPYFVLCKSCFWCCTSYYFNKSKRIRKCPCCDGIDSEITSMPIFFEKKAKCRNNALPNKYNYVDENNLPLSFFDSSILWNNSDIDDTNVNDKIKRGYC